MSKLLGILSIIIIFSGSITPYVSGYVMMQIPPTNAISKLGGSNDTVVAKTYNTKVNFIGKNGVTVYANNLTKTIIINGSGSGSQGPKGATGPQGPAGPNTLDTMQNVGTGQASIYAGNNTDTNFQFKTLKQGQNVQLANNTSDVTISASGWQNNTGTNLGINGIGLYSGMSGSVLQFLKLVSANNQCGFTGNSTNVILTCTDSDPYLTTAVLSINADTSTAQRIKVTSPLSIVDNGGGNHTISCATCSTNNANITGSGSANEVSYFTTSTNINGATNLLWDNTNKILKGLTDIQTSLGTSTDRYLDIYSSVSNSTSIKTNTIDASTGTKTSVSASTYLDVNGGELVKGLSLANVTKTGNYNISNRDDVIYADGTSSAFSLTLPDATSNVAKWYEIKKIDSSLSNIITIKTTSSQLIDGLANYNMTLRGETLILASDGTTWHIMSNSPTHDNLSYPAKGSTLNRWYGSFLLDFTPTATSPSSTSIQASPIILAKTETFDQIQIEVSTLVAGSTCRMGIYNDNGNDYPSGLVTGSDVGTVLGNTTGVKTNTFASPITLQAGLYWLANQCSTSTTIQLRAIPVSAVPAILGIPSTMGTVTPGTMWAKANVYGAFPNSFPSAGVIQITNAPEVLLRTTG